MSKPSITIEETNAFIEFFNERKKTGEKEGLVQTKTLLPLLYSSDQTAERINKIIAPFLANEGILLSRKGLNFEFKIIEAGSSKPGEIKTQFIVKEHLIQDSWESKPTRLPHAFMPGQNYGDIKLAIAAGDTVHIVGPPGCGKSISLENVAMDFKLPFVRMSLGGYLDPANLLGDVQLCESEKGIVTHFVYGILPEMAERGGMVIFDELDQMEPGGNSVFQRITETDGQLVIKTHDRNRPTIIIQKHPNFRMAFTSNTEGHGDITGMFAGAQQQNTSLLDRINSRFFMGYSTHTDYHLMKEEYKLPSGVIKALFGASTVAKLDEDSLVCTIRKKCEGENGWRTHLTSRMLMDVASHYSAFNGTILTTTFSWHKTMLYYFVNKFPYQYRKLVLDLIRTKIGPNFEPTEDNQVILNMGEDLKSKGFFPNANTYLIPSVKTYLA